jgi:hypothetical protein
LLHFAATEGQFSVLIHKHGPLVDGFVERLRDELATWSGGLTVHALKGNIRKLLLDYHRNEVARCSFVFACESSQ